MDAFWSAFYFLLGGMVTALLRAGGTRFMDRARPSVRVLAVRIAPTASAGASEISIDFNLIVRERDSPILPKLSAQMKVEDVRQYVKTARSTLQAHNQVVGHVAALIGRHHLLGAVAEETEKRRLLLMEWAQFGKELEAFGLNAITHYWSEVKEKYKRPHPTEWRDPQRAVVVLRAHSAYNLREIDVEQELAREMAVQGPLGLEDRLRRHLQAMNVIRRFWIYLDEDDLRWFLSRTQQLAQLYATDAAGVIDTLEQIIAVNSPEHLIAELLVGNDGRRAFAVGPSAFVRLPLPSDDPSAAYLIGMVTEAPSIDRAQPAVVDGNTARLMTFRSEATLAELAVTNGSGDVLDGARLRAIFQGATLRCQVGIAVGGFGLKADQPIVSEHFSFGTPADAVARKRLAESFEAAT